MSRSRTYRPAYLSEEQRAELAHRARQARFQADILPVLREQLRREATSFAQQHRLSVPAAEQLERRVECTTTAGGLRRLALELVPEAQRADADLAGLQFDLSHLTEELASLRRTAQGLGIELVNDTETTAAIEVLHQAIDVGDTAIAMAAASRANVSLDAQQECQRSSPGGALTPRGRGRNLRRGADMADDTHGPHDLALLDDWHVGVSVDRRFTEREVEDLRRRVTIELASWAAGLAGRLGLPTSRLQVKVEQ